jgi:hypothetical protein
MHAALKSALEELSQTQLADDPCTDTFEMDVLSRGAIWKMAVAPDLLIPAPSTLRGHQNLRKATYTWVAKLN